MAYRDFLSLAARFYKFGIGKIDSYYWEGLDLELKNPLPQE